MLLLCTTYEVFKHILKIRPDLTKHDEWCFSIQHKMVIIYHLINLWPLEKNLLMQASVMPLESKLMKDWSSLLKCLNLTAMGLQFSDKLGNNDGSSISAAFNVQNWLTLATINLGSNPPYVERCFLILMQKILTK